MGQEIERGGHSRGKHVFASPLSLYCHGSISQSFNFLPKHLGQFPHLHVGWMDGWVRVLRPFNSISVISRRWKGEHERLCAMKRRLGSGRISPPAGFEPATPWSEVGSANRSATRTLLLTCRNTSNAFITRASVYETLCPQHMLVSTDNLETRLLYYTICQSCEREIIQPNIYRILLKVNQVIYILHIICMPHIMIKAQGVLQTFCWQGP